MLWFTKSMIGDRDPKGSGEPTETTENPSEKGKVLGDQTNQEEEDDRFCPFDEARRIEERFLSCFVGGDASFCGDNRERQE